jgi:dipeptidyl aminopeptidase/acylaminoacyl peptidase
MFWRGRMPTGRATDARFQPTSKRSYATNFKTPTLVTRGELNYRVPIGQGEGLFTALQKMKIPSKMFQFADEGQWILKPQNSQFWYATVLDWLGEYTKQASAEAKPAPGR